ncbi:MAG: hypothetical protein QW303_08895 [Nitrososphaerota archaeon]
MENPYYCKVISSPSSVKKYLRFATYCFITSNFERTKEFEKWCRMIPGELYVMERYMGYDSEQKKIVKEIQSTMAKLIEESDPKKIALLLTRARLLLSLLN